MEQFIGCDAHKKFSIFASIDEKGEYGPTFRVGHAREVFRAFLKDLPAGYKIALETSGCYYWMVDEMEQARHIPLLAHALTAKRRMEGRHKTNERDARGLAMLLRNGTLPVVWIPPAEMRDQREMLRWRMSLSRICRLGAGGPRKCRLEAEGPVCEVVFRRLLPRLGYQSAIWAIAHRLCAVSAIG